MNQTRNGISNGGFREFVEMTLEASQGEERLEKLKNLAFRTMRQPGLSDKDEMVNTILVMLREVHFSAERVLTEDNQLAFLALHKELFDLALEQAGESLPKTKETLAFQIFSYWNPDPILCGYSSPARVSPLPMQAFLAMIHVYDEAGKDLKKKLDGEFRAYLTQASFDKTEKWMMVPELTEGLGNHLAKHRTRIGGFQDAKRDVRNSQLLYRDINHMSAGALVSIGDNFQTVCHWEDALNLLTEKIAANISIIGYQSRIDSYWDFPTRLSISVNLHSSAKKVTLTSLNSLRQYVKKELGENIREWCAPIVGKPESPKQISVEIFEQEDLIGRIDIG
jgi:hypothetical protein